MVLKLAKVGGDFHKAGKITGMLLDLEDEKCLLFQKDPLALRVHIDAALAMLREAPAAAAVGAEAPKEGGWNSHLSQNLTGCITPSDAASGGIGRCLCYVATEAGVCR